MRETRAQRAAPTGLFDARYSAFVEAVADLRPRLHRYCARMTGSALDGEDVMQDALFEAYRKIGQLDDASAIRPWLFRIAHNRCIDLLRNRRTRERTEASYAEEDVVHPAEPVALFTGSAIERLVIGLPPKERACVLLKDVFDHSLEEIAELVDSTVGGVKAALSRGRTKLAAMPAAPSQPPTPGPRPQITPLLERYVELFNRRDWDGVRSLTSADAKLLVADLFNGALADSPYFIEYERAAQGWRAAPGWVDGEPVLLILHPDPDRGWRPVHTVRLHATGGAIDRITDYLACPWVLSAATSIVVADL